MRIGFVGTGWFAGEHARSLARLGATVAACFGTNQEKTHSFAKEFDCRVFDDPLTMIDPRHIDVLFITIPPFAHDGSVEFAAIKNKIPFLCEKPIGLNVSLCKQIAAEVTRTGLVTSSGYLLRYGASAEKIKALVARNKIVMVRACRHNNAPAAHWWRTMDQSGGMMVEQATHTIDFLRFIFGEIASVQARAVSGIVKERFQACDVYDAMETQFVFQNGVLGSVGISNVLENSVFKSDLCDVVGRDFILLYNDTTIRYKEGCGEWQEIVAEDIPAKFDLQNKSFLTAVTQNKPELVLSTYGDALKTLMATMAMNASAQDHGRQVPVVSD